MATRVSVFNSKHRSDRLAVIALALAAMHCGVDGSVDVIFPTAGARDAVAVLKIDAYAGDTVLGCDEVLGLAQDGEVPNGVVVEDERLDYPLSEDAAIEITKGRTVLHVLAFTSDDIDAPPFLEGCTDRLDTDGKTDDLPIELGFVLPASAEIVKVSGDRQVALGAGEVASPIVVQVESSRPKGGGAKYVIPGVPFVFESRTPGFLVEGALEATIDGEKSGTAEARITAPVPPGNGQFVVTAVPLESRPQSSTALFDIGVRDAPVASVARQFNADGRRVVDSAIGDFTGDDAIDLVVVGCAGPGMCTAPDAPLATTVRRIDGLLGAGTELLPVPGDFGVAPAAVEVMSIRRNQRSSVVVLDAFRRNSQGAELHVIDGDAHQRFTMTGSNAVALVEIDAGGATNEVGVVASGRRRHTQRCLGNPGMCIAYEPSDCGADPSLCGCPPGERCDCLDCDEGESVCIAEDEMLDVLTLRGTGELYNRGGCQEPVVSCNNNPSAPVVTCGCNDDRGGSCVADEQGCRCQIPKRIRLEKPMTSFEPTGAFTARLDDDDEDDVVFASRSGLGFLRSNGGDYIWSTGPSVGSHDDVIALHLDDDQRTDLVWATRSPCTPGAGFQEICPIVSGPEPGEGCLGLVTTDGLTTVIDTQIGDVGSCSRKRLPFLPHDICAGDFNDDGNADVAITSRTLPTLAILIGDGSGGLSDPDLTTQLPGMNGGELSCGDVDGVLGDDVVVVDGADGTIAVITFSAQTQ